MTKFSIITPTLMRNSLFACCSSIELQTCADWEHIVQIDEPNSSVDHGMIFELAHPKRKFSCCEVRHNNFGNTCRHLAWERCTGDWVIHLDDDNFLHDPNVLKRIDSYLDGMKEKWAIFPIMRHGQRFFSDPPGTCYVDTANMVIRREIAQWPNRDEYTLDGIFCEQLKEKYPYASFPEVEPIVVMEHSSEGK
jgi:glycosyltransferase involved in cell wall biosynthesis